MKPRCADSHVIAAWLIAFAALFATLRLNLLPALLAGLLVYELVHVLAGCLPARFEAGRAKLLAIGVLVCLVIASLSLVFLGAFALYRSDSGSMSALLRKMAEIIDTLPAWLTDFLPRPDGLKEAIVEWLREHASELQTMGKEAGHMLAHVVIGVVVGAMVALNEARPANEVRPLAAALQERARRVANAFHRIVFAQVRISLINTVFTAIYLAAVLPLAGVHLPLVKSMILVTFLVGLLPVVGNLISNTVIIVVSLSHSPHAALASVGFLVVIHKLEYFLNARIVGSQISARAWELLLAMLLMEAAFGIAGLVAAPIFYAYLKDELAARGQV